jgi:hypothetical protein
VHGVEVLLVAEGRGGAVAGSRRRVEGEEVDTGVVDGVIVAVVFLLVVVVVVVGRGRGEELLDELEGRRFDDDPKDQHLDGDHQETLDDQRGREGEGRRAAIR